MKAILLAVLAAVVAVPASAGADLRFEIRDGKVTLDARDVTVRQILAEWARVGQTRIINLERVGSGPMTLQLSRVPERQALDIILRSASGYLAAPRPAGQTGASAYDRILILATSTAVSTPRPQTPSVPGRMPAGITAPRVMMPPSGTPDLVLPDPVDPDEEEGDAGGPPAGFANRPGMLTPPSSLSESQGADSAKPPAAASSSPAQWSVPAGTAAPGVVPASPQGQGSPRAVSGTRPPQPDR